jgi:hypothetical protein
MQDLQKKQTTRQLWNEGSTRAKSIQQQAAAGITGPFPQLTKQTEQHITMKDSGRQQHHLKEKNRANWPLTLRSEKQ